MQMDSDRHDKVKKISAALWFKQKMSEMCIGYKHFLTISQRIWMHLIHCKFFAFWSRANTVKMQKFIHIFLKYKFYDLLYVI